MSTAPQLPPPSEEQLKIISFVNSLAGVVQQNFLPASAPPQKSFWQRLLEALGGATLVTAILGIAGTLVSGEIQKNAAYNERMVAASKDHIAQEQEIVKRAYELIGSNISAADDLIALTGKDYAPGEYEGEDLAAVKKQRREMRENYNTLDAQWRNEQVKLGLLMTYYHQGNKDVLRFWRETESELKGFKDCVEQWHHDYENDPVERFCLPAACAADKSSLLNKLEEMTQVLEGARRASLKAWEAERPSLIRSKDN